MSYIIGGQLRNGWSVALLTAVQLQGSTQPYSSRIYSQQTMHGRHNQRHSALPCFGTSTKCNQCMRCCYLFTQIVHFKQYVKKSRIRLFVFCTLKNTTKIISWTKLFFQYDVEFDSWSWCCVVLLWDTHCQIILCYQSAVMTGGRWNTETKRATKIFCLYYIETGDNAFLLSAYSGADQVSGISSSPKQISNLLI